MKLIVWIFGVLLSISILLLLFCGELPSNPADSTSNVTVTIFIRDGVAPVQDQLVPIGIIINIPKLVQGIEITFGDSEWDSTFTYSNNSTQPDTVFLSGKFSSYGRLTITATATLVDGLMKEDEYTTDVIKKALTIHIDTVSCVHSILAGKPDTLKFNAATEPAGGAITFSVTTVPIQDTNAVTLVSKDTIAFVIMNSTQAGTYSLKVNAQSGDARDSSIVSVTSYNVPALEVFPANDTIGAGEADTLIYIVKKDTTDSLSLQFLNADELKSVASILKFTSDTLIAIFNSSTEGTFTLNIEVSGRVFKDTISTVELVKSIEDDTLLSEVVLLSPVDESYEVDTLPTFSWSGGTGKDGDTVFYKVRFGLSETDLDNETAESIQKSAVLTASSTLKSNTKYYWQVIAYSKTYTDTSISEINSFTTFNKPPVCQLASPVAGANRVNVDTGVFQYNATDPEGGTMKYVVVVDTNLSALAGGGTRSAELSMQYWEMSNLTGTSKLLNAKKYYWQVIAIDNPGLSNSKSDTSDVDSFYTENKSPVWTEVPSKDSTYYRCIIDLSRYCTDPEGSSLTYKVISGNDASIEGSILNCIADSVEITIQANDNFAGQPCSSTVSFRRWFVNPGLMKVIPAQGVTFAMGSNSGEVREAPVHSVSFTNSFYMDSTEVTQMDYAQLMGVDPSKLDTNLCPVENLTWYDAVLYCNARSKRDGLDTVYTFTDIIGTAGDSCTNLGSIMFDTTKNGYRLPTEAEWEFACRANTTTKFYWGAYTTWNNSTNLYAWVSDGPYRVAQKLPNGFDLYDMSGNVGEWCYDWYGGYPEDGVLQINPTGPDSGDVKIVRGYPRFTDETDEFTSSFRKRVGSTYTDSQCGFRCVRTISNK